ncbi:MAG TPA: methyltransferase [Thermoanaerobaculia bacterium]|nr:methyltransferase [Thermoanaerobaculia bacterium]
MNGLTRLAASVRYLLWRPLLRRRLGRVVVEEVGGMPLLVLPEVFNPAVFRTGAQLAQAVLCWAPAAHGPAAAIRVLDLGTGSGVGAVFAARRGFRVMAVDINPQAVRCARMNALLHRLEGTIEVRQGDLFGPVAGERFDLVLFNPPFFRGQPVSDLDRAWRSTDVLERFAAGVRGVLQPVGEVLVALSTDGQGEALLHGLGEAGLALDVAVRRDFGNEVVTVYRARPTEATEAAEPVERRAPPSRAAAGELPAILVGAPAVDRGQPIAGAGRAGAARWRP